MLYKRQGSLFSLVTDQGYEGQPVVWERIMAVDGDTQARNATNLIASLVVLVWTKETVMETLLLKVLRPIMTLPYPLLFTPQTPHS